MEEEFLKDLLEVCKKHKVFLHAYDTLDVIEAVFEDNKAISIDSVDGVLVGSASLDIDCFCKIIK